MKKKSGHRKKGIFLPYSAFLICLLVFCLQAIPAISSESPEKTMIFFYSSESGINNFKSLKSGFDAYLSRFGNYEFQPFSDRATFEEHIRGKQKCLLLLSSWHYNKIHNNYMLLPFLTGVRNGKNSQKRILVASVKYPDLQAVIRGPVASSGSIALTRSILEDMFGKKEDAEAIRILTVPKDIDALMSVGFEMARCALITESTLASLKTADPVLYGKIQTLIVGKESLLPVMAGPKNFAEEAKKLIRIIRQMPENPEGADIIKMLDLDTWEPVNASDSKKLEG